MLHWILPILGHYNTLPPLEFEMKLYIVLYEFVVAMVALLHSRTCKMIGEKMARIWTTSCKEALEGICETIERCLDSLTRSMKLPYKGI